MMCITDINYVLMSQGHWDCIIHCMVEKDNQVQWFSLVDKDQNGP